MSNLKLGVVERYDICEEIIKKYNIKAGTVSPCTRLMVIDTNETNEELDIKKATSNTGVDIKKPS